MVHNHAPAAGESTPGPAAPLPATPPCGPAQAVAGPPSRWCAIGCAA